MLALAGAFDALNSVSPPLGSGKSAETLILRCWLVHLLSDKAAPSSLHDDCSELYVAAVL
jgi:hypothetical protein